MIQIAQESLATFYVDIFALVILTGIFVLFQTYNVKEDRISNRLFISMCVLMFFNALFSLGYALVRYRETGWPPAARRILPSLEEFSVACIMVLWVLYADYKIFGSRDRIRAKIKSLYFAPMLTVALLAVINIFTGILFDVGTDMDQAYKPLYYVAMLIDTVYGLLPVVLMAQYKKRYGSVHFFSVMPVVVPLLITTVVSVFTPDSVRALAFATGMVFLLLSYGAGWRYDDQESRLYNRHYMEHLKYLVRDGKRDYHSALFFQTGEARAEFFELLRTELPREGELVRTGRDTVLLLLESNRRSTVSYFSDLVQEAAEEYEERHPEKGSMDILISTAMRKKSETAMDFIDRIRY